MKFKYTALGASNQKLEGVLDADSIEAAREELHKMGMSVIAINEVSAEEAAAVESTEAIATRTQEGIVTYYFVAKDPIGKEVNGTIDSKDANSAFRRLMTEYQFEVLDLYPQNSANPGLDSAKPQFKEWKNQMEDEGIDLSKKAISRSKGELDEGEKMSEEITREIDQFIINSKAILEKHPDQYSDPLLREIKKTLDELEMVRSSNNIKHITKVCNDLYELIANPDKKTAQNEKGADQDYEKTISMLKSSGFVANPFEFLGSRGIGKNMPGVEQIQRVFAGARRLLGGKKEEAKKLTKKRGGSWLRKIGRGWRGKEGKSGPGLSDIISKFFDYVAASSPVLRHAKKQEMLKYLKEWQESRKQRKTEKNTREGSVATAQKPGESAPSDTKEKIRRDFSPFFMEIDSFIGWLIFFYISYFFLVSFSIEKNIGLPQVLVLKTLNSPLIINISIFLLVAHLALTLKLHFFRSNFLGSLFLFFLSFGAYAILMVNF